MDDSMRILLIGPPGSGKGTQAQLLEERLGLTHIGTGDLLREAVRNETPTGKLAKPFIERGELVPDDVVNKMVEEYFRRPDAPRDFVLDGYPRNRSQAIAYDGLANELGIDIQAVVQLQVPDDVIVERLAGRRICPVCKAVYHVSANPPRHDMVCDVEGAALVQREDDKEETIRHRLQVYHERTEALADYYRTQGKLHDVTADAPRESVYRAIVALLEQLGLEKEVRG